jgi:hypothetical protein
MHSAPHSHVWVDPSEIAKLPMSGKAWEALKKAATSPLKIPDLSNQDDHSPVTLMAKGLYFMRTGDAKARIDVIEGCVGAMGTETKGSTLALGRNLLGIVVAADSVGFRDPNFVKWVDDVRTKTLDKRTLISTHEDRPSNWGTHAGASRVAAGMFLRDYKEVTRAAKVWEGLFGNRSAYAKFKYGDLSWQADKAHPVGINSEGSKIDGHSVDGCIPDDQRRGGEFSWPPPVVNYTREFLQGTVAAAHMLKRCGFNPWFWEDMAVVRSMRFHIDECGGKFEGDDECIPWIVNFYCKTKFPTKTPAKPAKCFGWSDWTHAR